MRTPPHLCRAAEAEYQQQVWARHRALVLLVKAGARDAVHWAFGQLKEQLNKLAPVAALPVVDAPELPGGELAK